MDWTSEHECFHTFLRELAIFYIPEPLIEANAHSHGGEDMDEGADQHTAEAQKAMMWQIQHVLFPAMARYLIPPKALLDRDVVQVADLPALYRVFERC